MMLLDHRACAYLLITLICLGCIFYQVQSPLMSIQVGENQGKKFLSAKRNTIDAIKDVDFLTEKYPDFLKLTDEKKVIVQRGNSADTGWNSRRKVHWIKTLEAAKSHLKIDELRFEIFPLIPVTADLPGLHVAIGSRALLLQVALVHDGQLAALLAYLDEHAPYAFSVTSLEIERVVNSTLAISEHRLHAEITIKWHLIEVVGANSNV